VSSKGEQLLPLEDKAMPRRRYYFTVALVSYRTLEIKRVLESNDYARWPAPPWFSSRQYYAGYSEAFAARALLRASLDAYADELAESVSLRRDGEQVLRLLPGQL
jgi:hypothetical protein